MKPFEYEGVWWLPDNDTSTLRLIITNIYVQ